MRDVGIGRPGRGTATGRPIMVLLDLMGRRWTLRILWELDSHGPLTFSALLDRCETISPGVLSQRLRELCENEIVEQRERGYGLTRIAMNLRKPLRGLYAWSEHWASVQRRRSTTRGTRRKKKWSATGAKAARGRSRGR